MGDRPQPTASVVTVATGVEPARLVELIESLQAQSMPDVEVIVALTNDAPAELVAAARGSGVTPFEVDTTSSAVALDRAAAAAQGGLVAWVAADAAVVPDAVDVLSAAMVENVDVVYGDHDERFDGTTGPVLKPDFSPERLRGHDYMSPLLMTRRGVVERLAPATDAADGAELHDVALRLAEVSRSTAHVPRAVAVLDRPASRAPGWSADAVTRDAVTRVVADHCRRVGIDADVVPSGRSGIVRLVRNLSEFPLVSVVIPTRGGSGDMGGVERCYVVEAVRSLVERSAYPALEFVVVHDADTPATVLDELDDVAGSALVSVPFYEPFNFATKMNVGVAAASGELLLFLNDDTELIAPRSLEVMVGHLLADDVAMVGAKLLFEDGTLQHGGHVYHHKIHHACFGWPGDSPGPAPLYPLAVERECSGVTAAAALVRRRPFDEVGGFDPAFPFNYNDVDLSLKLRAAGHRIIWTPHASWYHFESRTRTSALLPEEVELIEDRWGHELRHDPYYHPDLSPDTGDWTARVSPSSDPAPSATTSAPPAVHLRERVVSRLLGPAPARPRGVNLVGYLDSTSGLGDRARELAAVLDTAGIRHSDWNLGLTDSERVEAPAAHRLDDGVVFDTTIAVVTALAFPGIGGVHGPLLAVDRVIGYWFWELAHVPETHRPAIETVDEIWAPTRFVRDAYAAAVDEPVELVPLPISRPQVPTTTRDEFGFRDDEFVFVTSFDHLSSMQRKYPTGVIEAFQLAFPGGDEAVRLVVKSINGHLRSDAMAQLAAASAGDPRIELRDEYLAGGDQSALLAAADALVSLHRSEGLGLHIAEAMWLGTPVIATRYSGSLDFTEASNQAEVAELVDATLVAVEAGGEAYREGRWAEPDLDQAASAMRRLVTDDERRCGLAARARERMESQADRSVAGERVRAALAKRERSLSRRERVAAHTRPARHLIERAASRFRAPFAG